MEIRFQYAEEEKLGKREIKLLVVGTLLYVVAPVSLVLWLLF